MKFDEFLDDKWDDSTVASKSDIVNGFLSNMQKPENQEIIDGEEEKQEEEKEKESEDLMSS